MTEATDLYAQPLPVETRAECYFYHSIDLPGYGQVVGEWDLRGRTEEYLGWADFRGKRVLDVGTASGFLTFEAERMGAREVVSVEADTARRINLLPMVDHEIFRDYDAYVAKAEENLNAQKRSYWLSHRDLKSKAQAYYGDIYNLPSALGRFDVVVVAQILVHLRDPIAALASAAALCDDTLIIAEGMLGDSDGRKVAQLLPNRPETPASIWWQMSVPLYKEVLHWLGFDSIRRSDAAYRAVAAGQDFDITTLVAKRRR